MNVLDEVRRIGRRIELRVTQATMDGMQVAGNVDGFRALAAREAVLRDDDDEDGHDDDLKVAA